MVKHNNAVPREHFHKDWQRFVKTWFDQPARKVRRRTIRQAKAAAVAPRPLHSLKPIVRCQTLKYNKRVRAGRGFTITELKQAGIVPKAARGVGIAVDKRRKNRSEEGLKVNVDRLKAYMSKLVVFPTTRAQKESRVKKGKTTPALSVLDGVAQNLHRDVLAIVQPSAAAASVLEVRKITAAEKAGSAFGTARKALIDEKMWGKREKRAASKSAEASKGKKAEDDE